MIVKLSGRVINVSDLIENKTGDSISIVCGNKLSRFSIRITFVCMKKY